MLSMMFFKRRFFQLAVDGPSGCGKSSCTALAAKRLGFRYIDSGALYRCLALKTLRQKYPADDDWSAYLRHTQIELSRDGRVWLDSEDVTYAIRTADVTRAVVSMAAVPSLRTALVSYQRALASAPAGNNAERGPAVAGVAMEGRDIGSVVLPDAHLKVYMTADVTARAQRRHAELVAAAHLQDPGVSLEQVARQLVDRDTHDTRRRVAPLCVTAGATVLDTTHLSRDQAVDAIVALVHARMLKLTCVGKENTEKKDFCV